MSKRSRKTKFSLPTLLLALLVIAGAFFANREGWLDGLTSLDGDSSTVLSLSKEAQVYFIDVGQGDSELIRLKQEDGSPFDILIDAGTRSTKQELSDFLHDLGVEDLDIVIGTHPHEDHIGGMAQILQDFPVETLYLPEICDSMTPTTRTYENMLDAIDEKQVTVRTAAAGDVLFQSDSISFSVLSPSRDDYDNLNDFSIVTRLVVGETSFLFQGDAEADVEAEILDAGYDVSCDVLKLGHHGSSTSSSEAYITAASPKNAVISCGVNNDYGHPHAETLDLMEKLNINMYRTDEQKTLLAETDGKTIEWETGLFSVIDAAG